MKEVEWVKDIVAPSLGERLQPIDPSLSIRVGYRFPYAYEICAYENENPCNIWPMKYETDLLIIENNNDHWTPRIIIETKANGSITTHDAITYSHKAAHSQTSTSLFALRHPFGRKRTLPPAWKAISTRDTIRLYDLLGRARTEQGGIERHHRSVI